MLAVCALPGYTLEVGWRFLTNPLVARKNNKIAGSEIVSAFVRIAHVARSVIRVLSLVNGV